MERKLHTAAGSKSPWINQRGGDKLAQRAVSLLHQGDKEKLVRIRRAIGCPLLSDQDFGSNCFFFKSTSDCCQIMPIMPSVCMQSNSSLPGFLS